jgi:cobyrinic acid a,c-diamide synthase
MVLGAALTDTAGARHDMTGLLPLETSFAARRLHLGYRQVSLASDAPLGARGTQFRGHEFHYATVTQEDARTPLFAVTDATGRRRDPAGTRAGQVMGSFIHLIDCA